MNVPDLLVRITAWLRTPVRVQDLRLPLRSAVADLARVNRDFRDAVGRNTFRGTPGRILVMVDAPKKLALTWGLGKRMHVELDLGDCVGLVLRRLFAHWRLPAEFFSCDLDMLAPAGLHPLVHIAITLQDTEVLVIVDDYTEHRSLHTRIMPTWAFAADRFVPQWIFKLPSSNLAPMLALMPPCVLQRWSPPPIMLYDAYDANDL